MTVEFLGAVFAVLAAGVGWFTVQPAAQVWEPLNHRMTQGIDATLLLLAALPSEEADGMPISWT